VVEGIRRGAESLSCVMFNCVVVDTCKRAVLKCLERRGLVNYLSSYKLRSGPYTLHEKVSLSTTILSHVSKGCSY
jgi:hypothetical protein